MASTEIAILADVCSYNPTALRQKLDSATSGNEQGTQKMTPTRKLTLRLVRKPDKLMAQNVEMRSFGPRSFSSKTNWIDIQNVIPKLVLASEVCKDPNIRCSCHNFSKGRFSVTRSDNFNPD